MTTTLERMARAAYTRRSAGFTLHPGQRVATWDELDPAAKEREIESMRAGVGELEPYVVALLRSADRTIDEPMAKDMVAVWLSMVAGRSVPLSLDQINTERLALGYPLHPHPGGQPK